MAIPVTYPFSGASRRGRRAVGADGPHGDHAVRLLLRSRIVVGAPKRKRPRRRRHRQSTGEAKIHTASGQALARSGKTEEALAEYDKAIALDPHYAEALYSRGLLYQTQRQHQLAIDDFRSANGLTPQRAEPLLARAISYLAMDKLKEAAADLDEASQADPQNAQIWTTPGTCL